MATIGKVSAVFSASTAGLKAGVNDASTAFKKLSGDVAGLRSGMRTLVAIQGAQLFGQLASGAMSAARSFVSMGIAQADVIGSQKDLAARLGMTYGELAGLGFAGAQVGVSMETIGKAATKADVAFIKASQGSKVAQAAFSGIGLSVEQLEGLSPAERFRAIADSISALPTAAERSRAAIQVFGKAGAELLPMFEGGAGAITAATEEAAKFGLALTNEQANSVDSMGDAFDKAQMAVQGIVGQVVAYLAPAIQGVTDTFLNLIGGIGGANIGQFIGEGIMMGAQFLAGIADWVIKGIGGAFEYAGVVTGVWNRVVSALQAVFFLGEAAFKGIAAILARSASGWAMLLDSLPDAVAGTGWAEFGKSMEDYANTLATGADAAARNAMTAAGNVITGDTMKIDKFGGAGPLSTILADGMAKARADAAARSVAETGVGQKGAATPTAEPAFTGASAESLKATDSRSKEGMSEMFRLMRNSGVDIAEQQLEEQRKTNELLSDGEEMAVYDMGA